MDIRIVISADKTALEFSRNLAKLFGGYVSQSDIEAGICGKLANGITATLEPDTMPWEDEAEKGRLYAAQAQKEAEQKASKIVKDLEPAKALTTEEFRAKSIAYGRDHGNEAVKEILKAVKAMNISSMDENQRLEACKLMDGANNA